MLENICTPPFQIKGWIVFEFYKEMRKGQSLDYHHDPFYWVNWVEEREGGEEWALRDKGRWKREKSLVMRREPICLFGSPRTNLFGRGPGLPLLQSWGWWFGRTWLCGSAPSFSPCLENERTTENTWLPLLLPSIGTSSHVGSLPRPSISCNWMELNLILGFRLGNLFAPFRSHVLQHQLHWQWKWECGFLYVWVFFFFYSQSGHILSGKEAC